MIGSGCGIMAVGAVIPAGQKNALRPRRSGEASGHTPQRAPHFFSSGGNAKVNRLGLSSAID